ncbi:MAG: hypothetical protein EBR82_44845 [Caulobacteraceae bacterium]|nr:hypothetical protein [Caulobacteraceae bacterium]
MAKAYLGKISALVTANTSDFNSKLNASANELRNFAKSVQSNITRTTQDANRAFSAILTPLQKFEASLRAASSMRLSFKGFQGAIKDVEELKARLATLKDSQVNLVVNASGMKSLTDFRNAIGDITNKDIRVLTDVGGIEKLRELRNIIETEDGRTIATQVRVKAEDLDRIIAKFERIDKRQIDAVIRVLGEQDLEAAVVKQQQLASAAKQVAEPLAAAVAQFGKLSTEVQTAFIPALNRAQDATQNLQSDIEAGVRIGQERFKALESQVLRTAEAIGRLSEAAATVSTIRTGRELEFQQPRAQAALTAARAVSGEAVGNVALNPRAFEASQAAIKRESDALVELIALRESANEQGERGTASVIQAQIDTRTASLERQTAEYRRLIAAEKEAAAAQQQAGAGPLIARARAEREYYEESRRLANQAAADAAAPLIARASAERDFYEESERLQRQAASDEAALLIRRARAQQEFEDERRRLAAVAAEDAAAEIAPAINRARVQRESAIDFGLDLDAPKRQLEVLRGSVVSVKGQLDALPVSIRSQFVPAILEAQRNLEALAAAPAATTEQIENAAAEVDRLSAATRRASQASQVQGFGDFINDANVRQAVGELQGLQRVLIQVGAVAGGPAARAYEAYRARLQEAISTGTTGLPTVRRELERLQRAAVEAAAATGRISVGNAFRQIQRAGDVARGGVDRLSLALNQAAFAIDDFFSST